MLMSKSQPLLSLEQCACKQTDHGLVFKDGQLLRQHQTATTNGWHCQCPLLHPSEAWRNCCSQCFSISKIQGYTSDLKLLLLGQGAPQIIICRKGFTSFKRIMFSKSLAPFFPECKTWWICNVQGNAILIKKDTIVVFFCWKLTLLLLQNIQLIIWWGIWEVCPSLVVSIFFLHQYSANCFLVHFWMHYACHHHFCWSQYMDAFLCVGPRQEALRLVLLF